MLGRGRHCEGDSKTLEHSIPQRRIATRVSSEDEADKISLTDT